jgi:chemotaxis protein CheD
VEEERVLDRIVPRKSRETENVLYLYPGDIHATSEDVVLRTVLGSCVSVCIWDPVARVGGMNHFLLAKTPPDGGPTGRYGDSSTLELIAQLRGMRASRRHMKAKVFGGAGVFGNEGHMGQLGRDNVHAALQVLGHHGIAVTGQDVGGTNGRRVVFRLSDGTTSCIRLGPGKKG